MSLFTRSSPSPDTDATDETSKRSTAHASASDDPAAGAPARTGAPVRRWLRHRTAFQDKYPLAARGLSWGVTALAAALVYFALLMPGKAEFFEVRQFLRIPVEPILGAALLMVLPSRPGWWRRSASGWAWPRWWW